VYLTHIVFSNQFDVTTDKGLAAFNGFMGAKSYIDGYSMSATDTTEFEKFQGKLPDPVKLPHAYRWYIHIAALTGSARGLSYAGPPVVAAEPTAAPTAATPAPKATATAKAADDDDDFDVFGDDDVEGGDEAVVETKEEGATESRAEMLARLKKEAELRTIAKEAKQRTLVAIEIKPWDVEQDLLLLFKKISETITQDGLKWAENCNLADVAFGIKKIQTTFTMGATKYVFLYRISHLLSHSVETNLTLRFCHFNFNAARRMILSKLF
jgi:elongation factor 1-beta